MKDIRLPPKTQGGRKPFEVPAKITFSLDGKRSVILYTEKLIRMLQIKASHSKDLKVMAGYLGAIEAAKLLALTIDPTALTELNKEVDLALKRMRREINGLNNPP